MEAETPRAFVLMRAAIPAILDQLDRIDLNRLNVVERLDLLEFAAGLERLAVDLDLGLLSR